MPYTIDWLVTHKVIYSSFSGETTEDDMRDSLLAAKNMIESSENPHVHVISDTGNVTKALPSHKALQISRQIGMHDRLGWNIVIRERSALVKMGVAFATVVAKSKTRSFDSLADAEAFLRQMDESVDWDKADHSVVQVDHNGSHD